MQKILISIFSGFLAGVFVRSFVDFGWAMAAFFVFIGVALLLVFLMAESRKLVAVSLFFVAMGLGVLRYSVGEIRSNDLSNQIGQRSQFEAVIIDEPDERENYTRYTAEVSGNKILITTNKFPEFKYGDKVKVSGTLKTPGSKTEFSWQDYLAKDDIFYEMFYPGMEFVSSGSGSWAKTKMFVLKNSFLGVLGKIIPEPYASFAGGLTIGAKRSIPKNLQEDFKTTGVIHIVVLSGYNITLVADFVMRVFSFLPKYFGISFGAIGIVLFVLMTGASATAVRASIMALLAILARTTGRVYEITWALFITAFLMVLYNPKILRFDTSFQLSFLATLSLIYLSPKLKEKFTWVTEKWQLREIVASTVSAQVFVLPLLLYKIGSLSLVALPVNFLILVFVPVTMFLVFIAGGLGILSVMLATPFGWASYLLLRYEVFVVEIFARLPFAAVNIKYFPLGLMVAMYILYAILIFRINGRR